MKSAQFVIDKGIKIPPPSQGHLQRALIATFAAMELGDSFTLGPRSRQTLNRVIRQLGLETEIREERGELRVWLTGRATNG